ncbi:MAG: T9SS type A sorting domain-containing protein, partial [Bacteroidales bacterium]|nr:T9SS type A sorting domain-containing protein [Bacteroidales bacterium]
DDLLVTIEQSPTVDAGANQTICETDVVSLMATAGNYSSIHWTTDGDGTFSDATTLDPVYYPGAGDIAGGQVNLTSTAFAMNLCNDVSDQVTVMIDSAPAVFAGEDVVICETEEVQLSAIVENYSSLLWQTSGDGSFDDQQSLSAIYNPGSQDILSGTVLLSITAFSSGVCPDASDDLLVTIEQSPTVDAGENQTICETDVVSLLATAGNYSSIQWTTDGDGTFSDATTLDPVYYPGAGDIAGGQVNLDLKAYPQAFCSPEEGVVIVNIIPLPIVFAGVDVTICENQNYTVSGEAANFSTLVWSTGGDGFFDNSNVMNPTYTPGIYDVSTGYVELCLTAEPVNPCSIVSSDCMMIHFAPMPVLEISSSTTICENSTLTLTASALNCCNYYWETAGDGIFDDISTLNPTYTPGPSDIGNGTVELCLVGVGCNPCNGSVIECIELSIQRQPIVFAGNDGYICGNSSYQLEQATAEHYSSLLWTTSGDGIFGNATSISTTYTPGPTDIFVGFAAICLTVEPVNPCFVSAIDCLSIEILPLPDANAGQDKEVCITNSYVLLQGFVSNYTSFYWTTTGTGYFDNPAKLNPRYFFSFLDKDQGYVNLVLHAVSASCGEVTDTLLVTIHKEAIVYAGLDESVCSSETFETTGATASNVASVYWTTTGDGYFESPTAIITQYHPGVMDIQSGAVMLCLNASAFAPCADISDCMKLILLPPAFIDAGEDIEICETESVPVLATAMNHQSVLWQTSGDGIFENPVNPETIYLPGVQDISNGSVTLSVEALSNTNCGDAYDELLVHFQSLTSVFAGNDFVICEDGFAVLTGSSENAISVKWTTDGDGAFEESSSLQTSYIPGEEDITNGEVELCLTAYSGGFCPDVTDCITLYINPLPVAFAGDDATICKTDNYMLNGGAQHYSSSLWFTSGDGTFDDPGLLNATYTPGVEDLQSNQVDLTLFIFGLEACSNAQDSMILHLNLPPQVVAGDDTTICENDIASLSGSAHQYENIIWQTDGDGFFGDVNSLNTTYTPGSDDVTNGSVELCITATGYEGCDPTSDCLIISISRFPVVSAGEDLSACVTDNVSLNATADFTIAVNWSSSGDGSFIDPGNLVTEYIPGPSDLANGFVELCLTGTGAGPCDEVSDCALVTFIPLPIANAGQDVTIGKNDIYLTSSAVVGNNDQLLWTTSGTGSFNDPASLVTFYTPSLDDIVFGSVTLTLTAFPVSPCQMAASDEIVLKIEYTCLDAKVDAGADASVCLGNSYQLSNISALFNESIIWETTGDGTFDDNTILTPVYTPGINDISSGSVVLCLTGIGFESCDDDTDCMELTIQYPPLAFAGYDNTVPFPEEEGYPLEYAFAEHFEYIQWFTTNGMGYFSNEQVVNPIYYPSFMDVSLDYVELQVNCSPINPCEISAQDVVHVTFIDECDDASVTISEDTISHCITGTPIQVSATGFLYSAINWTTSGDGQFISGNTLNPQYILGANDLVTGEFMLTVDAIGFEGCQSAIDSVKVFSQMSPTVFAGSDQTICDGQTCLIEDAFAANYELISWSTSGDGYFSVPDNVITEYIPGFSDSMMGVIEITLTAEGVFPCEVYASSTMLLTIDRPFIIVNLSDSEVHLEENVTLTIEALNADFYQWFGPYGMIDGANQPIFTIYNAEYDDSGSYYCEIINSCTSITSNVVTVRVYELHQLIVPEGWSGISSWIVPYHPEIVDLFANVHDDLVLLKNLTGVYCPLLQLNILNTWNSQHGYEVKFANNVTVDFKGQANENLTVTMNAGWNYLPVISRCPVNLAQLFGSSPIVIIKEISGPGVYWPVLGINTIGYLLPGKAYMLCSSSPFSATYPICESTKSEVVSNLFKPDNQTPWNPIHFTSSTHVIAFDQLAISKMPSGSIIGAFNSEGLCTGVIQVNGNTDALTVFGDDALTIEHDGMLEENLITFRLYDPSTGNSYDLDVEYDQQFTNHDGEFRINGLSRVIDLKTTAIGVGEYDAVTMRIYPNPTSGEINIAGIVDQSYIEVYSTGGQLLQTHFFEPNTVNPNVLKFSLESYPAGVYYLKIISEKRTEVRKIILR